MRISFRHRGVFRETTKFLIRNLNKGPGKPEGSRYMAILNKYGRKGVAALRAATPIDSGETAKSWSYKIKSFRNSFKIIWKNSNINDGLPIAIIIQYGHGTGTGGYVQGKDYINPALKPIFDKLADDVWREVTNP